MGERVYRTGGTVSLEHLRTICAKCGDDLVKDEKTGAVACSKGCAEPHKKHEAKPVVEKINNPLSVGKKDEPTGGEAA